MEEWLVLSWAILWTLAIVFLLVCSNDKFEAGQFDPCLRRVEPDWNEEIQWEAEEEFRKLSQKKLEGDNNDGYRSDGEVSDDSESEDTEEEELEEWNEETLEL